MSKRANYAVFESKTLGLIDTLKLTHTEVVELALDVAISFSGDRSRSELRALLDAAVDQSKGDQREVSA